MKLAAGWGSLLPVHLSPPTSRLARRSGGGTCCWTGEVACLRLSPADFGPGLEAVAEGRAAGWGDCFSAPPTADLGPGSKAVAAVRALDGEVASLRLSPLTSGIARRRWRGGVLLDEEIASLRLSPSSGLGRGSVVLAEGRAGRQGACFSAPLAADFGPGPEAMLEGRAAASKGDNAFTEHPVRDERYGTREATALSLNSH